MSRDREHDDALDFQADDGPADQRDEALGAALRASAPPPPIDDVDWTALHARITAAAPGFRHGRQATPVRGWWQPLAGWSPRGIPLAAAASLLLMLAAAALTGGPAAENGPVGFRTVEEELADGLSAGARSLFADGGSEAVLDVALFSDGEDW
jgi:hypothetical protein